MTLFDLYAKITLDSGDYEKGIDSASKKSGTLTKSLETTSNRIKTLKSQQADARKEVERLADAFNKSAKETGTDSKQTQELAKQLKDAENNVESITKEIDDYNESLRKGGEYSDAFSKIGDIGHKVFNAVKVAAVAGGAALTAFTKSSIDTGMEFDKAMSQVAATMGYTVDELNQGGSEANQTFEKLRTAAKYYGETTAFTSTQAAEALNYMALAGYDADTAIKTLPSVLNLAAAGGLELGYASDMITDSQTALGLTLDETNTLMDQMAKTASSSNTSVGQLGEAILTVGGTAQYMSGGTTELNTVLGVLADNGIKGSEAGTHLRNMLLSLAAPTDKAQAWMDKLGVKFFDAEGNMRSFSDVFPELNAAMSDLTQEQKLQAFADMFNVRDISSVNALLGTTSQRWTELGEKIENSNGAMQQMAETQLDNLAGDVTKFQSAFEGLKIEVSDRLNPVLRDLVQRATDFIQSIDVDEVINSLKNLWESFKNLLPVITGVTTAMIAYKTATAISKVIDALTAATEGQTIAQAALNAVMNANPFVLIVTLITGVVTALGTLALTSESFREKMQKVWDVISHPIQTIKNIWNDAKTFLSNTWDNIKNSASQKWQGIKDTISNAVENTKSKLSTAWENIKSNLSTKWENIKSTASSKWAGIRDAISSATENTRSKLSTAWDNIRGNLGSVWDRIKNSSSTKWNEITNGIQNIFGSLPDKIREIGRNILTGLWNGIKEKWQNFKDKCSGIVDNIKGLFSGKSGFDSHSPSRWAETLFENLLEGGEVGLDNAKGALFRNVGGIVDDVKNMMGLDAISGNAGYGVSTIGNSNIGTSGDSSDIETVTEYNMQVTINLNGSDYTSQRQIAEEISVQLQNLVNRRSAAWA